MSIQYQIKQSHISYGVGKEKWIKKKLDSNKTDYY